MMILRSIIDHGKDELDGDLLLANSILDKIKPNKTMQALRAAEKAYDFARA